MPIGRLLDTDKVAFGILDFDEPADGGNFALRHDDLAAIGRDGGRGCIDVVDRDRAFVARHALAGHDFMPLLQGPLQLPDRLCRRSQSGRNPAGPQG